jgi:hypothetical protein
MMVIGRRSSGTADEVRRRLIARDGAVRLGRSQRGTRADSGNAAAD